jgi:hypothetical protein
MSETPEAGLKESFQYELERSWKLSGAVPVVSTPAPPPTRPVVQEVEELAQDRPRVIPMRWPRAG